MNTQLTSQRKFPWLVVFHWVMGAVVLVSFVFGWLGLGGCAFLGANKMKADAATPIHIIWVSGTGYIGDKFAHDNWIQLCATNGKDAHPANPDPKSGWTDLGSGSVTEYNDTYEWVISQEAYDQYGEMDSANLTNPGLYMPSTSK